MTAESPTARIQIGPGLYSLALGFAGCRSGVQIVAVTDPRATIGNAEPQNHLRLRLRVELAIGRNLAEPRHFGFSGRQFLHLYRIGPYRLVC